MTQEDELILRVRGEEELKRLNYELVKNESNLKVLLAAQAKNPTGVSPAELQAAAKEVVALNAQIVTLEKSLEGLEEKGGGFKMRGGMRADLILAHAFREMTSDTANLQQKLESLARTIPYTLAMFGTGGPWLLGLTLAGTAVVELASKWRELMAFLGDSAPLDAAKHLEEMADRAKAAIKGFQELVEAPTEPEAASMKAMKGLLAGRPGRETQDALIAAMQATGQMPPGFEDLRRHRADVGKPGLLGGMAAQEEQEHQERLKAAYLAESQRILGAAVGGKTREEREEAMLTIRGLYGAAPKAFPGRFGEDLAKTMPDEIARKQEVDRLNKLDQARILRMSDVEGKHRIEETKKARLRKEADEKDMEQAMDMKRRADEAEAKAKARAAAQGEREFGQEVMGAAVGFEAPRARRRRLAERQAGELMAQGPEIVGQALGPRAAQMASMALPEEVQAMKERTIRNLEGGARPYDALLQAFHEVARAAERRSASEQQFMQNMMGLQSRQHAGPDHTGQFSAMNPTMQ
jgi:hypothetical protein